MSLYYPTQQQLALLKILVVDVLLLCPCLVVYKRILVLWWWWQWKRWQSTKRGTLAKQMPEWATDKQIVPPHTMIEEHCLQNAEDETWLLPNLCPMLWINMTVMTFALFPEQNSVPYMYFYAVFKTWLLPPCCRLKFASLLSATSTLPPPLYQFLCWTVDHFFYYILYFILLLYTIYSLCLPPLFLLHYINSFDGCLIIFSFLTSNISLLLITNSDWSDHYMHCNRWMSKHLHIKHIIIDTNSN